jgi:RHS repeat-associated protein
VLYWSDGAGHLLGEYSSTGAIIEETIWLGDLPVATLRSSGSTVAVYYVHSDQLNIPRAVTRRSDNKQMWSWFSDPFRTTAANANPQGGGSFPYNLRFPGQLFNGQAGLHQNGYRDYDPAIGRYPTGDPSGLVGGINPYGYSGANPISNFDPSGLYCTSSGGMTSCSYPGGPSFQIPTPPGFPADIGPGNRALYHKYDVDVP